MLFLPSTSPSNPYGYDIILATYRVCTLYSTTASFFQCTLNFPFTLNANTYYFLGKAEDMGMTGTPTCGS